MPHPRLVLVLLAVAVPIVQGAAAGDAAPPAAKTFSVKSDADGTFFLELEADVPDRPSVTGIRYGVFRNGAQVLEGKGSWNVNYVPFYAVDRLYRPA